MSTGLELLIDKIALRFCSKGRVIDGVWIGSFNNDSVERARELAESAFALIKHHDPVQYRRICRHLKRIWVTLIPTYGGWYNPQLGACVLNEKYVLSKEASVEKIALTIVHEATHARLQHLGIQYDEKKRSSIENICMGREVALLRRLPGCEKLLSQAEHKRQYYAKNPEFFSDPEFRRRYAENSVIALRDLGVPSWPIKVIVAVLQFMGKIPRDYRVS